MKENTTSEMVYFDKDGKVIEGGGKDDAPAARAERVYTRKDKKK